MIEGLVGDVVQGMAEPLLSSLVLYPSAACTSRPHESSTQDGAAAALILLQQQGDSQPATTGTAAPLKVLEGCSLAFNLEGTGCSAMVYLKLWHVLVDVRASHSDGALLSSSSPSSPLEWLCPCLR
jgi:hypothetical protein